MVPFSLKHYETKPYESVPVSRDSDLGFVQKDP